jgi:hypothetical protein
MSCPSCDKEFSFLYSFKILNPFRHRRNRSHRPKGDQTGITFSLRKPIPDELVERLARASRKEVKT